MLRHLSVNHNRVLSSKPGVSKLQLLDQIGLVACFLYNPELKNFFFVFQWLQKKSHYKGTMPKISIIWFFTKKFADPFLK